MIIMAADRWRGFPIQEYGAIFLERRLALYRYGANFLEKDTSRGFVHHKYGELPSPQEYGAMLLETGLALQYYNAIFL